MVREVSLLMSHTGTSCLSKSHSDVSMRGNYVQTTCFLAKKYKIFLQLENLSTGRSEHQALDLSNLIDKSLSQNH